MPWAAPRGCHTHANLADWTSRVAGSSRMMPGERMLPGERSRRRVFSRSRSRSRRCALRQGNSAPQFCRSSPLPGSSLFPVFPFFPVLPLPSSADCASLDLLSPISSPSSSPSKFRATAAWGVQNEVVEPEVIQDIVFSYLTPARFHR